MKWSQDFNFSSISAKILRLKNWKNVQNILQIYFNKDVYAFSSQICTDIELFDITDNKFC